MPCPQGDGSRTRWPPETLRRADRLFRIVQELRGRRLVTAQMLAERLQVSQRTIYRDVRDLMLSGVPVEGEAGIGYVLRRGFDLPPLMFDRDELEALVVGVRMVQAWGGGRLAASADAALAKIEAALPESLRRDWRRSNLFAPTFHRELPPEDRLDRLREALNGKHVLEIDYVREDGRASTRLIRPLALYFWGPVWTLAAWCESSSGFRSFRVDRIQRIDLQSRRFAEEPGKSLADFMRAAQARGPADREAGRLPAGPSRKPEARRGVRRR